MSVHQFCHFVRVYSNWLERFVWAVWVAFTLFHGCPWRSGAGTWWVGEKCAADLARVRRDLIVNAVVDMVVMFVGDRACKEEYETQWMHCVDN